MLALHVHGEHRAGAARISAGYGRLQTHMSRLLLNMREYVPWLEVQVEGHNHIILRAR